MQRHGHERFAGAGGRVEDDVLLVEQFQAGGFPRGIKLQSPALRLFEKASRQHILTELLIARNRIVKRRCHRTRTLLITGATEKEAERRPDREPVCRGPHIHRRNFLRFGIQLQRDHCIASVAVSSRNGNFNPAFCLTNSCLAATGHFGTDNFRRHARQFHRTVRPFQNVDVNGVAFARAGDGWRGLPWSRSVPKFEFGYLFRDLSAAIRDGKGRWRLVRGVAILWR